MREHIVVGCRCIQLKIRYNSHHILLLLKFMKNRGKDKKVQEKEEMDSGSGSVVKSLEFASMIFVRIQERSDHHAVRELTPREVLLRLLTVGCSVELHENL